MSDPVLLTWLATRNDPYERVKSGGPFRESPEGPVPGATLNLLTDPASPYANCISDMVVLRQGGVEATMHDGILELKVPKKEPHPEEQSTKVPIK